MNAPLKNALVPLLSLLWWSMASAQQPSADPSVAQQTDRSPKPADAVVWKPTASWKAARREGDVARGPRLAMLVSADEARRSETVALQALLEVEAFGAWHGELLERAQLEVVLREQRLAVTLADANAIKLGQVAQADFLLMVGIEADRVRCRVNQFPSTTVIVEFELPKSSEDRLAKQIALRAFRAMTERSRDQSRVSVAIGSFLVDDPFSKYTDLDQLLHAALRERLSKVARIDLAERFHPTQLLREFELARAGLVPSVMAQLTAPVSDVLIVGDVQPTAKQELNKKDIELEYRIRVVSPTGLFEAFDVKFLLPKADANRAADQIAEAVQLAVTRLPELLERSINSDGLATEYQTLKQRAFSLLPSRPQNDGNFFNSGGHLGSWQSGKPAVIERAMRAVENALLLKGDDTQLIVCAVPLLFAMAASETPHRRIEKPSPRQKALLEMSCDYIETALALNFNHNTRGIAYESLLGHEDYWYSIPDRTRPIVERMAREGVAGGWYAHEAESARMKLIRFAPDMESKIALFRIAQRDGGPKADSRFRSLEVVANHYLERRNAKADASQLREVANQLRGLADELAGKESALSRGMGRYLLVFVAYYSEPREPRWQAELREAIDLIPAVSKEDGPELPKYDYTLRVYDFVRWSNEKSSTEASRELLQRYIKRQVEIQNYRHGNLAAALSLLLPTLKSDSQRAEGLELLTNLLERYNDGGSADFDRMRLARWRNHFQQTLSKPVFLTPDRLVEIKLDPAAGQTRVKKLLWAFDHVWALRCDYHLQDRLGEIHRVAPTATAATRVKGLSDRITDLAAASDQLAVASIDNGLTLVDRTGEIVRQIRPDNSPLPTLMVRTVASDGSRFILGLPGVVPETGYGKYFLYELDPKADTLKKTATKLDYDAYYQSRFDKVANRFVFQTFDNRFHEVDGQRWTFHMTRVRNPMHRVTVTDSANKAVFDYTGFELNYVYDFVHWRDRLFFATGNGLYVARPGTDKLICTLNELDLEFSSLCPVGDKLFIGTNRGLHRLDATVLARLDDVAQRTGANGAENGQITPPVSAPPVAPARHKTTPLPVRTAQPENQTQPAPPKPMPSGEVLFRVTATDAKSQPLPADPPTLLFPQPIVADGDPDETRGVAELLAARLSAEIEQRGLAQLVDRAKLDAILKERVENPAASVPLDSYDALIRLKFDRAHPDRAARLQVIALSTGASLGAVDVPWPVTEAGVEKMIAVLQRAAPASTKPLTGRLRVRLVDAQSPYDQQRMQPLARKLRNALATRLADVPNVQVMEHIEAATTKEESLLQLMKLSRLPGQRDFSPEADVLIELLVQEVDAIDKVFEQTVISAGMRRTPRGQPADEWAESKGTVSDFDQLVRATWFELRSRLALPLPAAPQDDEELLRTRRQQAFNEIRAAGRVVIPTGVPSETARELRREQLAHLDTALKIDPTCEQAAYARLSSLSFGFAAEAVKPDVYPLDKSLALLKEHIDYHDRFGGDSTRGTRQMAFFFSSGLLTSNGMGVSTFSIPLHARAAELSDDLLQGLQRMVETLCEGDPRHCVNSAFEPLLVIVNQNLSRRNVATGSRDRWIDEQIRGLDRQVVTIDSWPPNPIEEGLRQQLKEYLQMTRLTAMKLAVEEKRGDRAAELFEQLQTRLIPKDSRHPIMRELEYLVQAAASPRLNGSHAEWLQLALRAPKQQHYGVSLPQPPELVIADVKIIPPWIPSFVLPGQEHFRFNSVYSDRMVPLVATEDRLYVLLDELREVETPQLIGGSYHNSKSRQRVAWIPCDKTGRPSGESRVQRDAASGKSLKRWSTLQELPPFELPDHHNPILQCACVDGERLFVGTQFHGLLVFDLKQQTWRHIGPEQGLPAEAVYSLMPTGDGRILAAGHTGASSVHFIVSSQDLSTRLMYRSGVQPSFPRRIVHAWRVGDEWWGLSEGFAASTPLWRGLGTSDCRPAFPIPKTPSSVYQVELRYEPTTDEIVITNLRDQETLRWKPDELRHCGPTWRGVVLGRTASSVKPTVDSVVAQPVFIGCGKESESVFPILVTKQGCWFLRDRDAVFLSTEDAGRLAADRKAGGTAPVQGAPATTPVAQARRAISDGKTQQGVEMLHALLDKEPKNVEALWLMGFLAGLPGVKTPVDADTYFERMAKLDDNDQAYTGLMWLMSRACERGDGKRAAELEERIYTRFPESQPILAERLRPNKQLARVMQGFKFGAGTRPVFMLMVTNPFDPEPKFSPNIATTPPR